MGRKLTAYNIFVKKFAAANPHHNGGPSLMRAAGKAWRSGKSPSSRGSRKKRSGSRKKRSGSRKKKSKSRSRSRK